MDATPFEQEVELEATKLTDVLTVLPLVGLVTVTLATADAAANTNTHIGIARRACFFMRAVLRLECDLRLLNHSKQRDRTNYQAGHPESFCRLCPLTERGISGDY
jgi:hypothetical protein